jgi:hypothetical protein
MNVLEGLQERRAQECRLTPDRALETLDDAEGFLRERGLMTRNPDCSLPSLFGACHEEPYRQGAGGFGDWPKTKWTWSFELPQRAGVVAPKIHSGKTLYLGPEAVRLVDPIVRAEIDRLAEADSACERLLDHLAHAGPSSPTDLQVELGLRRQDLKQLRAPLERCGALVTRFEPADGEWASTLYRWDQLVPEPAGGEPELAPLVAAGIRAAVVTQEREVPRWFSWRWRWERGLIDQLAEEGLVKRPAPGWVSA